MSYLFYHAGSAVTWLVLLTSFIIACVLIIRRKKQNKCTGCSGCCQGYCTVRKSTDTDPENHDS